MVRRRNDNLGSWVAFAKHEPFIAFGDAIREPGEVWFEFGSTSNEAMARLKTAIGLTEN